jgi:hypothetical protein
LLLGILSPAHQGLARSRVERTLGSFNSANPCLFRPHFRANSWSRDPAGWQRGAFGHLSNSTAVAGHEVAEGESGAGSNGLRRRWFPKVASALRRCAVAQFLRAQCGASRARMRLPRLIKTKYVGFRRRQLTCEAWFFAKCRDSLNLSAELTVVRQGRRYDSRISSNRRPSGLSSFFTALDAAISSWLT